MTRSCPLTTLRSLFVSAMAVSALLPAAEGPIQASPVNANPAFESLRATASDWGVTEVRAIPAPAANAATVVANSTTTPALPLTAENLKKLLDRTSASRKPATITKSISILLGLTKGDEEMRLKAIGETAGDAHHTFAVSQKADSDDIIITNRKPGSVRFYLTNRKLELRAAGVHEYGLEPKLIVNEKAQPDFEKELKFFNDAIARETGNS